MEQMNNETIDACIEAINNNATKSDENKARLIDMYESMRPEPTGPTNETVIAGIKKWSKGEMNTNVMPSSVNKNDLTAKEEIENWAKRRI